MFHKDTKKEIQKCHKLTTKLEKKIDEHIDWGKNEDYKIQKALVEHDSIMKHIIDALPEKGFCEKINKTLYDETGKDKVELMWHDRRWIKALIGAVLAMGGINVIIHVM